MTDPRPIKFKAAHKFKWIEQVSFDPRSTDLDARVAIAISSRIDPYYGTATVGQVWISEKIDCTDRAVRDSTNRMAANGHLDIDRSESGGRHNRSGNGRGKANIYRPIVAAANTAMPERHKAGSVIPVLLAEKRKIETVKPEPTNNKSGSVVPYLPLKIPDSSFDKRTIENEGEASWLSVKEKLRGRLGAPIVTSWFDRLIFVEMRDGVVTLLAPSQFVRSYVSAHWGDVLEVAWQSVTPTDTVNRVTIAVEQRRAAE